jgi:hypothetical protein
MAQHVTIRLLCSLHDNGVVEAETISSQLAIPRTSLRSAPSMPTTSERRCSLSPTTPAGRCQEQVNTVTPVVPPDYPRRQAQLQPQDPASGRYCANSGSCAFMYPAGPYRVIVDCRF